ncbi:MAG: hypothetical protein A2504_11055 [Bdellovibrionales bacterium RIFOXYD12_FULL_39_22]|nr:MAG: hypothetical protein A2385_09620 [Bdellovibrionales bacterium RIFOXYB1_FULL_39_21]OFZ44214.1 MAG: hypothetical protein A2485_07240 [Bdellovibrionales bacterium RIFOXYC12_FULL_39_17]OFZ46756.1 MAG: hypothetical protein A2404_04475 [Bdellovibrionales bacterium RIFOXYC1_FULL_39_130]OFZ75967.1 MAG: hypothetical protein A2560_02675 [Bdellovibrionales bacterium RIFOXYD1_FULL_39_84]OFZ95435.1 MAG: hypothetical protein A2504_11055 [Bdellovibrionales bacterium RIFOXYD12_FULL_39_22]HLE09832.1 4F
MKAYGKLFVSVLLLLSAIIFFSDLSTDLWKEKTEGASYTLVAKEMTGGDLLEVDDGQKKQALKEEYAEKNWFKIPLKFLFWFAFLGTVFYQITSDKRRAVFLSSRRRFYLMAIFIFGVILGSDPSPMGTIKDAISVLGIKGVVFPPRIVAFIVFSLIVVFANKFICGWGCQFGALQDFIFRLDKKTDHKKSLLPKYKMSFVITNAVRILFFFSFVYLAFFAKLDIVEKINPFLIYKPSGLSLLSAIFIAMILLLSLFVYRPWCSLFCPFGLSGWLLEKFSRYKIRVNKLQCTNCRSCVTACPINTMEAILEGTKRVPDCYSCFDCVEACPSGSISFTKSFTKKGA